jgi:phosphoribosylamine--glycine ligase
MLGDATRPGGLEIAHNAEGARVVIEDFMPGEEASFIVLCDGSNVLTLATSQDHKRIGEGDSGPNTGGMGAYSPAPVVTPNVHAKVMHEIIQPTIAGMARDGHPFTGFLYAGLMIDAQGQPRTVEFNCRLGDPEAQVILMRLKSDLFELLMQATEGGLDEAELEWDRRVAVGVVMAAHGYPAAPRKGDFIDGLSAVDRASDELQFFHAGTTLEDGQLRTSGGRVLCVVALADSVRLAQAKALAAVRRVRFEGAQWRNDIGHRAIKPRDV